MTGPYGGHAAEPHMMHKQFDLRIQQQRAEESSQLGEHLGRPRSARYQARHISRSSGTASDTQNKMIALGFIALLTSSFDEFGGLVPRPGELSGPIPSRRSAAPQPEVEKTVKPVKLKRSGATAAVALSGSSSGYCEREWQSVGGSAVPR